MQVSSSASVSQSDLFRQFRGVFENLTGLPLDVLVPGEYRIPDGAPDFCKMMGLTPGSCGACRDIHAGLQEPGGAGANTVECFAGLTSTSVPVKAQGRAVAFLHTGHVFLGRGGRRNWVKLKKFLRRHGLDPDACEQALQATKCADPSHYESAVRLLEIFAKQLSESLPSRSFGESYPAVEQAVRMMREDLEQDWTLSRVAGAVKMNPSYFSDMFRKSTGDTFSACLARLRVERACRMLQATKLGVGEVAFAAGFRSISQFNRTFKRLTGKVPGEFRRTNALR